MNEEMNNNNNNNNVPNYNYEKKNNGVKVLLIVVIVLLIALISLLSYKIFVVDGKNDIKQNNNVSKENGSNNTSDNHSSDKLGNDDNSVLEEKIENIDINNTEIQKYYNYVNSDGVSGTIDTFDYDRLNKNKNYNAFVKLINQSKTKEEKCSIYLKYIEKISPNPEYMLGCSAFSNGGEEGCSREYNEREGTMISTLEEETLKEAVETIYGKGSYKPSNIKFGSSSHFEYIAEKSKYILINHCGGGTGPFYSSKLIKGERSNNNLFIYEELTDNSSMFGEDNNSNNLKKLIVKHTFEKNSYDDNFHYSKTEKAN